MLPWDSLTEAGRIRRLRFLATAALTHYGLADARLSLVGGFTNVIYRVDTDDERYALRVDLHQDHSDGDVDIEVSWLEALSADTAIPIGRPVRSMDGRAYVHETADGVPGARRCTLFTWVPGRPLADRITQTGYEELGRLSAALHHHGAGYSPELRPMAWDRIFYWPEEVDPVVIFDDRWSHLITSDRRALLERAMELVSGAFDCLDTRGAQVVHGDLHPWNVHTLRGRLWAIDFEDVMWALPVQDVAITLYYQRNHPEYPALRRSFTDGYTSLRPWPETHPGQIELFMAARTIMFMNYVLNLRDDPVDFLEVAFPRLEGLLRSRH